MSIAAETFLLMSGTEPAELFELVEDFLRNEAHDKRFVMPAVREAVGVGRLP